MVVGLSGYVLVAVWAGRSARPTAEATRLAETRPPNIVVYVVDTLRADHLPMYGYPRDTAPHLTQLAREGYVFERAYTVAPWTKPAVGSMMTGLYPDQHGATNDVGHLRPDLALIPSRLKKRGYRSVGLQTNGNASRLYGFDRGFDLFQASPELWGDGDRQAMGRFGSKMVTDLIEACASDLSEPFFLFAQSADPHDPYEPRGRFREFVAGDGFESLSDTEAFARWSTLPDVSTPEARALTRHVVGLYDGEIKQTDREIGRLVQLLKARGAYDRTAILVTSDHGEGLQDHGIDVGHSLFYEHTIRVPLILKPPGPTPPRRISAPVQHIDLLPTLLALSGQGRDPTLPGRNLLDLAGSEGPSPPRALFFSRARDLAIDRFKTDGRAVLAWPWKLIQDDLAVERYVMFDLQNDPGEHHNLWSPERVAAPAAFRMLREQLQQREAARPAHPYPLTAEGLEELRALGYVR